MIKNKIYKSFCIFLASLTLFVQPVSVLADELSGESNVGDSTTSISHGQSGQEANGNTTNNTDQSSGENQGTSSGQVNNTYQPTKAEAGASSEKSSVDSILKGFINKIKNSDSFHTVGVPSANGELFSFGISQIPDSDISNLLNHVQLFEQYLSQQDGLDKWMNIYDQVSVNEHPRKTLDNITGDWNSLSNTEKRKVKEKIAEKEGISESSYIIDQDIPLHGTGNYLTNFRYSLNNNPPFTIRSIFSGSPYKGNYSGIRSDLIKGGFQDFNSWSNRFQGLSRVTSNSMEDYCIISYIKDYHISKVSAHQVNVINWTSDKRRWQVINTDTGAVMHPSGADNDGYIITDNPEHALTMAFDKAGHYQVIAEQQAKYTEGTYVEYDICDYLFDAETQNLLYFNEKTVSNGNGGSVYVGGEEKEGWVKTGDVFNWTVNDLGEIEKDGSTTQRVE